MIDDHSLLEKTLKNFISQYHSLQVVVQVSEPSDIFSYLQQKQVDVLLIDIYKLRAFGIDFLKIVKSHAPDIKIITLAQGTELELMADLLDFGIHACICKDSEPEELIQAIHSVAENRIFRNKLFTEALYYKKQTEVRNTGRVKEIDFEEREKKILQMMWEEKSNKEIANAVFLSVRTVEKIRQDMKEKLGVRSTVGLLKYAISRHVIQINHTTKAERETSHNGCKQAAQA